jgi:hypothetical protein
LFIFPLIVFSFAGFQIVHAMDDIDDRTMGLSADWSEYLDADDIPENDSEIDEDDDQDKNV